MKLQPARIALSGLLLTLVFGCGEGNPTSQSGAPGAATPTITGEGSTTQPTGQVVATAPPMPTAAPPAPGSGMFQNPVLKANFADPGVTKVGDTYYGYATNSSGKNIQVARSKDLISWEVLSDAMPALAKWIDFGNALVWAPEMIQINDQFVIYYTARDKASNKQCIGVAVSAKPEGKYKDTMDKPFICQADEGGSIDASPFRDGDKLYLYWKSDGNCCSRPTYLYVQELAPDGLSLVGEPTQLVRNDATWEGRVVEAPTMLKRDNTYYLFFSGNDYAGHEYAVGYATCQSPTGPCQDAPENPILASEMTKKPLVVGPGHQTVVEVGDETWMIYHVWELLSSGIRGDRRLVWMDKIEWKDGKPDILGPTTDAQPVPAP